MRAELGGYRMDQVRPVLLARPHPFIVAEMGPLPQRLGYAPTPAAFEILAAGGLTVPGVAEATHFRGQGEGET